MADEMPEADIARLAAESDVFAKSFEEDKLSLAPAERWYPYGSVSNLGHLDRLLGPGRRDLRQLAGGDRIADIGAADGDMAFYLASKGFEVDIIDWGPTNWNGLAGARLLAQHYNLPVEIHEIDLDAQFSVPRPHYGLILFLGILYHLQNPYFVLRALSSCSEHLVLSTRIAANTPGGETKLTRAPVAYLVAPAEMNNDPTNYWVFSLTGLHRILERTGWEVLDEMTVGCTDGSSDPTRHDRDERAFMLLRSANAGIR